jgi:signal transduction histidine kinase
MQELEQLKNNFVSLISHDLKTPIAKIQAVVNRLLPQHQGGELQSDLEALHASSEELHRYIQSILKVLRVESRDFRLHREVADINEVIEDAVLQLKPLAHDKEIKILTQLEPMFSSEFDVTLMKEVVINLIENAIKYSPLGSEIVIRSEERDNVIRVEVQDKGQGIAPDELEKVWQKFVRGKEQDLKSKGSGLGLYLVKYFIELHGGTVRIESELGKGSTVSFTLPVSDDMESTPVETDKHEVSA